MPHISRARSVAFLLQEQPLDDEEHGHLIRCDQCQQAMADAALEELASEYRRKGYVITKSKAGSEDRSNNSSRSFRLTVARVLHLDPMR